ncbi:hypothetical protein [Gloeobacter kilaueensis]|uniref:Uncharacterized protein n=1 Tax=Gloeobacter kilaueensis (strain ATCC BAA-2537 / CCAP 1431/1 / ULC 316 / JS1) TaxID=1183438 RepID=U5QSL2_GLOK1|nr:hypothetical protein [Gloeobacter kilaueensis]AGY60664.1 hypothetical protein GKIL_4418 [Gloeobacter kilaueensis JS1]
MLNRILYSGGALLACALLGWRLWRQSTPNTHWPRLAWQSFYLQDSGGVVVGGLLLLAMCWLSGRILRQATELGWFAPEESHLLDRPLQFWYGLSIGMMAIFAITSLLYWLRP